MQTVKFKLTFKQGLKTCAEIEGLPRPADQITIEEVTHHVINTERFLEHLTGLRLHIEQVYSE